MSHWYQFRKELLSGSPRAFFSLHSTCLTNCNCHHLYSTARLVHCLTRSSPRYCCSSCRKSSIRQSDTCSSCTSIRNTRSTLRIETVRLRLLQTLTHERSCLSVLYLREPAKPCLICRSTYTQIELPASCELSAKAPCTTRKTLLADLSPSHPAFACMRS